MIINLYLEHVAPAPQRKDYRIGAIGAGFIMSEYHLVDYGQARTLAAGRETNQTSFPAS
jgi:hypothetical protein